MAAASPGWTNYARLGIASIELLPEMMRELLAHNEPSNSIGARCRNTDVYDRGRKTNVLNILNPQEKNKVTNAHTQGYSYFDIPLVYKLLRNLNLIQPPTNGWDYPNDPRPAEITTGDDIERIRRMRNHLSHKGDTNISEQETADYFSMIKDIAERLEKLLKKTNKEFVSRVLNLQTCCLDEATAAKYRDELEKQAQKDMEIEKRVTQLEEKFKVVKLPNTPENIQFKIPLKDMVCFEGDRVSLMCVLENAKPSVKWYKNGTRVLSDHIIDESKDECCKLTICKATKEDSGPYIVKLDDQICEVNLIVKERVPSLIVLRDYQKELAEIALTGENTIVCAGTNAGKTFVALHLIEDHLLRKPEGKVVFMAKTNILLDQQFTTARDNLLPPAFKGKIYKWDVDDEMGVRNFADEVRKADLLFLTPMSLSNCLMDTTKDNISISDFTLMILDECHHTYHKDPFNEVMSHYRKRKFDVQDAKLPQILGLTASPGTNRAKTVNAAVTHLKKVMSNMDVSKLSVVRRNREELLKWSSEPEQEWITSAKRQIDPVKDILLQAMTYVENNFNSEIVTRFLLDNGDATEALHQALMKKRFEKTEDSYVQWIAETKKRVTDNFHLDSKVPRLLHACLRHLKLYASCLEINDLLEIDEVIEVIKDGYGEMSHDSQKANTDEEREIVEKLYDVYVQIRKCKGMVEDNPDITAIKKTLQEEYEKQKEDSRFLIFVKTRITAKLLAEHLPDYLNCCHLTGSQVTKEKGGLHKKEQLEVVDYFRNGKHLCIVSTAVACEGLDIPKCNLMIRYKLRSNEISSFQMRGRVRSDGGRKVLLLSDKDRIHEEENIERQYLMKEAIKRVIELDISEEIQKEEKSSYLKEGKERREKSLHLSQQKPGKFSVRCGKCDVIITDGQCLRHINQKHFIIYDKHFLSSKVTRKKAKVKNFEGITKLDKIHGAECNHNWGSTLIYHEQEFAGLSQDYIVFFDEERNKTLDCKKWSQLPYQIAEITEDEIAVFGSD